MAANDDLRKLMVKVISQTERVKETAEKQLIKSCEIIQAEKDDYTRQLQNLKSQLPTKSGRRMSSEQYSLAGRIAFFERKIRHLDTQLMNTRADYNARIRSAEGLIRLQKNRMKQLDRMPVNSSSLRAEIENWDQKTRSAAGCDEIDRRSTDHDASHDDSSLRSGSGSERNVRRRLPVHYKPPSKDGVKRRSLYPEHLSQNSKFHTFLRKYDGKPPPLPANLGYEAPDKDCVGSRTSHRSLYSVRSRSPRKGILRKRTSVPEYSSLGLQGPNEAMSENDMVIYGDGHSSDRNSRDRRYILSRTLSLTSDPPLEFFCAVEPRSPTAPREANVSPTGRDMRKAIRERAEKRRRENESPCSSFSSRENMQPVQEDRVPLATLDLFNVSSQPMDLAEKIDLWSAREDTGKLVAEIDALKQEQAEFLYEDTFESELSDPERIGAPKAKSLAASVPESCITEFELKDSEYEVMSLIGTNQEAGTERQANIRSEDRLVEVSTETSADIVGTMDIRHADSLSEAESSAAATIHKAEQRSSPSFPAILVSQAYHPAFLVRIPEKAQPLLLPGPKPDGETPDSGIASAASFGRPFGSPAVERCKLHDSESLRTATENSSGYSESIYDEYRKCIDEKSRPLLDLEKKLRRSLEEVDDDENQEVTARTLTGDGDEIQVTPRAGFDDESGVGLDVSPNASANNSLTHDSDSGANSMRNAAEIDTMDSDDRMFFEAKDVTTVTKGGLLISQDEITCGTYVEHRHARKRSHSVSGSLPRDITSIDISIKFRSQENLRTELMGGFIKESENVLSSYKLRKDATGGRSFLNDTQGKKKDLVLRSSSHRAYAAVALAVHELCHMDPTADYFAARSLVVSHLMPDEHIAAKKPHELAFTTIDIPQYAAKFAVVESPSEEEVFEEKVITDNELGDEVVVSRKDLLSKNRSANKSEPRGKSFTKDGSEVTSSVTEPPCEVVYFPPLYSDGENYTRLQHGMSDRVLTSSKSIPITDTTSSKSLPVTDTISRTGIEDLRHSSQKPENSTGAPRDLMSTWKFESEPLESPKTAVSLSSGDFSSPGQNPSQRKKEDILSVSYVDGVPYISLDEKSLKSGESGSSKTAGRKWSSADDLSEATESSEAITLAKSLPTIFADSSHDAEVLGLCKTVSETIREAKDHVYEETGFTLDDEGSDVDSLDSLPTHHGSTAALVYSSVDRTLYDGLFADEGEQRGEEHVLQEGNREINGVLSSSEMSLHDDAMRVAKPRPTDLPVRSLAWGSRGSLSSTAGFNPIGNSHFDDDDDNPDNKKSVSWSDLRGRPLEVGPSSIGNWDDSPKPIIKRRSASADRNQTQTAIESDFRTHSSTAETEAKSQQLIDDEKALQDILFSSAGAEAAGSVLTVDRNLLLRLLVSPESDFFAGQQRETLQASSAVIAHHAIRGSDVKEEGRASPQRLSHDLRRDMYNYASSSSAEAAAARPQASSLIQVDYVGDDGTDSYERSIGNGIIRDKMICDEGDNAGPSGYGSTVGETRAEVSGASESVLQKYRRLIGDLEVLTLERANILDSLGSDPAEVIDMSAATKKYLSEYRNKLLQMKAELDAKIDHVNDELNQLELPPEMQDEVEHQRQRKLWSSDEMSSVSRAVSNNDAGSSFEPRHSYLVTSLPASETGMSTSYSGHRSASGHPSEHRDRLIQLRKCLVTTCRDLAESYADSVLTRYSRKLSSDKESAEGVSRSSRTPEPYLSPAELLDEFRRARVLSRAEIGSAFRDLDRVRRRLTVSYETELPAPEWEMGFRERLYGVQNSRERLNMDQNIDREIASLARHYSTVRREYEPKPSSDWRNYRTENVRLKREERRRQGSYLYDY